MLLNDPDGFYSDTPLVDAKLNIRWRGHSTLTCDKKSYRIKLDEKASLLGINSDRDWYLIANHPDKTLMRNMVAMRISQICGMSWSYGSTGISRETICSVSIRKSTTTR